VLADISWPTDPDVWEAARAELADIIEGAGSPTGVEETDAEVPARVVLHANYPNPFNPATAIRFSLSAPRHVRLAVFDVTGREVAMLVDGLRSPGFHTVRFDAAGLPGGVYFYRLDAGEVVETRPMLRVR
jgi:hypothetical protein